MAQNPPFANVALLLPFDTPGQAQPDRSNSPVLVSYNVPSGQLATVNDAVPGPFAAYSAQLNPGVTKGASLGGEWGGAWFFLPATKLDIGTGNAAIEVWVRLSSADSLANRGGWIVNCQGYGYALSSGNDSNQYAKGHHSLWMNPDGTFRFHWGRARSDSTHQTVASVTPLAVDQWHFIRVSITDTTVRLWADGELVGEAERTVAMADYPSTNWQGYVIGGIWNQSFPGPKYNFVGNLGGLRVTKGYALDGGDVPTEPFPLADPTFWPAGCSAWPGGTVAR